MEKWCEEIGEGHVLVWTLLQPMTEIGQKKESRKKETEIENRKFLTNTECELILYYAGAVIDNVDRTIQYQH